MAALAKGSRLDELRVNRAVLAQALGVSGSRVQQLCQDGVLPSPEGHGYLLVECFRGYAAYLRTHGEQPADRANFNAARTRLLEARAEAAELDREEKLGRLVDGETFGNTMIELLGIVRARILGLPSMLAANFSTLRSAREASDWLQKQVYEALEELSNLDAEDLLAAAKRKRPDFLEEERID